MCRTLFAYAQSTLVEFGKINSKDALEQVEASGVHATAEPARRSAGSLIAYVRKKLPRHVAGFMRDAHFVCGGVDDVASMSLLENWIDEAERRVWFLFECGRKV
jgi:hypothetical protein